MLVLSPGRDEVIRIGSDVKVTVLSIHTRCVRLGIDAPKNVRLWREELFHEMAQHGSTPDQAEKAPAGRDPLIALLLAESRLLRKLLDVQECERKLISHEIHDGFLQDVIGAHMLLGAVRAKAESQRAEFTEEMNTIDELLGKAIAEAHRLVGELRPIMTGEQNLVEAIARLIAESGRDGPLHVEFERDIQADRMNPILQGNIFRIVQEALTNVKRHSRSKTAKIGLWQRDGALLLEIEDQGVGFDPNGVPDGCFGLKGIRERARLFGGRASIQSAPGEGTRILVELPGIEANHKQTVA